MNFQFRKKTLKIDIEIKINFFGNGIFKIKTFIIFFDYILSKFISCSLFDCYLRCYSDLKINSYYVIKNVSINLGILLKKIIKKNNMNFLITDNKFVLINIEFCEESFYFDNLLLDFDLKILREFFISFSKKLKCCFFLYIYNFVNKKQIIEIIFNLFGLIFKNLKKEFFLKNIL